MNVINEGNRMPTGMSDYCSESPLHFRKKNRRKMRHRKIQRQIRSRETTFTISELHFKTSAN